MERIIFYFFRYVLLKIFTLYLIHIKCQRKIVFSNIIHIFWFFFLRLSTVKIYREVSEDSVHIWCVNIYLLIKPKILSKKFQIRRQRVYTYAQKFFRDEDAFVQWNQIPWTTAPSRRRSIRARRSWRSSACRDTTAGSTRSSGLRLTRCWPAIFERTYPACRPICRSSGSPWRISCRPRASICWHTPWTPRAAAKCRSWRI